MSNQQYRGAQIPDHRSDWLSGRPPAPVWTSALSCPSSGNARLLPVYAGALSATASKLVYRKAKAGEISYAKGTRWETLTGAAYVDQDTISVGGSNVTATGSTTYLGLPCNYITWPAATHNDASSYCCDGHGATIAIGQIFATRVDLALSRALTGDEVIDLRVTGVTQVANRQFAAGDNLLAGQFHSVILNESMVPGSAAGTNTCYYYLAGTFSTPLTIYIRRRMLFDATGLDSSECIPDFIDPSVDYGFGAVGVKWAPTKCGNTVAANGVIIPGTGAALPEPMGVQWQPAATLINTSSPPTSGVNLTFTTAPAAVAGLPAKRVTATGTGTHNTPIIPLETTDNIRTAEVVVQAPASGDARPYLHIASGWVGIANWSTLQLAVNTDSGKIIRYWCTPLGNNTVVLGANYSNPGVSTAATLYIANSAGTYSYTAGGQYLDIASLVGCSQPNVGTPMLASGGATSRLADDPATGLPAIGTGPFTAFVDVTVLRAAVTGVEYPKLFSSEDAGSGLTLYYATGTTVFFYKDNVNNIDGLTTLTVGTRAKIAFRRTAAGLVALFVDGVKKVEVASTPYNSTTAPRFIGASTGESGYVPDAILHDQWLEYSALSDEDCIRVTRV